MKRRVTISRLIRIASLPPLPAALLLIAFVGLAPGSAGAAKVGRVTVYSVATQEQYVNNADDRARGKGNNPFGNFRDASATATHPTGAPYPGDEVFFKFNVFTSGSLNKSAGSATLTCQYNFDKNAFCDGYYQLDGGTLFGAGPLDFSSSSFAMAITGGTGKYLDMTGGIQGSPGPRHSQRLVFTLG